MHRGHRRVAPRVEGRIHYPTIPLTTDDSRKAQDGARDMHFAHGRADDIGAELPRGVLDHQARR